jgi:hypothetical protein
MEAFSTPEGWHARPKHESAIERSSEIPVRLVEIYNQYIVFFAG